MNGYLFKKHLIRKNAKANANSQKGSKFQTKDYVTLSISFLAIFISSLNFYYNNLRIEDNLQARVVDLVVSQRAQDTSINDITFLIAVINTGNRQAILLEIGHELTENPNSNKPLHIDQGNLKDTLPFVLEPNKVRLIPLRISSNQVKGSNKKLIITGKYKGNFESYFKFVFIAIDSKGVEYITPTPNILRIITGNKIMTIATFKDFDMPINVFKH